MSNPYEARYTTYVNTIEAYLDSACFREMSEPQQMLFEAMRYSLLAGGKRLRPVFVLDFCAMCGGDWEKAMPFAAALEMVHTYSLIHDDLPCMDNDDYRRGRLTNHKVYGEAMATLAGDGLLTAAFSQIAASAFDADSRIAAVQVLSACAGEFGMVGGQALDILSEERVCTEQEVLDIQSRKTGALIRAACILGVIAGGGSQQQKAAAADFASALGLAFQIRDDILDVIGDAKQLGKATGVDSGKNTFLRLYGLEKCEQLVVDYAQKAIEALGIFQDAGFMTYLTKKLISRMM